MPVAVAIAATAFGLLLFARLSPEPTFPTKLHSVDPADFSSFMLIEPPPGYQPSISQFAAEEAALKSSPGAEVREAALMRVIQTFTGTVQTVWVVSLGPGDYGIEGPAFPCFLANGEPYRPDDVAYMLTFIDPENGEFIMTISQPEAPSSELTCGDLPTVQPGA